MKKHWTTQNNANVLWTIFYLIAILFCKSHDGDPPFSGCVRGIKHLEKIKSTHFWIIFNVFEKQKYAHQGYIYSIKNSKICIVKYYYNLK